MAQGEERVDDTNFLRDETSTLSTAEEPVFNDEEKEALKEVLNHTRNCPDKVPPNMSCVGRKRMKTTTIKRLHQLISHK